MPAILQHVKLGDAKSYFFLTSDFILPEVKKDPDNTFAGSQLISRMRLEVMIYAKGNTTKSIAAFIIWRRHSSCQRSGFYEKNPSKVADLLFLGEESCDSNTDKVLSITKNHGATLKALRVL